MNYIMGAPLGAVRGPGRAGRLARRASPARVTLTVQFWAQRLGGNPRAPVLGIGPGGFDWHTLREIHTDMTAAGWAGSSFQEDVPQFNDQCDQLTWGQPQIDEDDNVIQLPDVVDYWNKLVDSPFPVYVVVTDVQDVVAGGGGGGAAGMGIGGVHAHVPRHAVPSRHIAVPRATLLSPPAEAVGPRCCVPRWWCARYGPAVAAAQAGGPQTRRFVKRVGDEYVPWPAPSFDGLHAFWHGTPYMPGSDFLVTLAQLVTLFEWLDTTLLVLGPDDTLLAAVDAKKRRLRGAAVLVSGGHLYPCDTDVDDLWRAATTAKRTRVPAPPREGLHALLGAVEPAPAPPLRAPAAIARAADDPNPPPPPPVWVDSFEEALSVPVRVVCAPGAHPSTARAEVAVTGVFNVADVLWFLRARGVGAGVDMRDGEVNTVYLRVALTPVPDRRRRLRDDGYSDDGEEEDDIPDDASVDSDGGVVLRGMYRKHASRAMRRAAAVSAAPRSALLSFCRLPVPRGEASPPGWLDTRGAYAAYAAGAASLRDALFVRASRSAYSRGLRAAAVLSPLPLVGVSDPPDDVVAHDIGLAYSAALADVLDEDGWVFGAWDDATPWDGRFTPGFYALRLPGVDPLSVLGVLCPGGFSVLAAREARMAAAAGAPASAWVGALRPARLVSTAKAAAALKAVFASPLARAAKRAIANHTVGMAGRSSTRSERTTVFDTPDEAAEAVSAASAAASAAAEAGGIAADGCTRGPPTPLRPPPGLQLWGDVLTWEREEPPVYTVTTRTRDVALTHGWAPIRMRVLSRCAGVLASRVAALRAAGRTPLALRTDAVYVARGGEADVPKTDDLAVARAGHFSVAPGTPPAPPKRWEAGAEPAHVTSRAAARAAAIDAVTAAARPRVPVVIQAPETDAAIDAVLDAGPTLLTARYPGSGKTFNVIRWAAKRGRSLLVLCPYNMLCAATLRGGTPAATYHRALRLAPNGEAATGPAGAGALDLTPYDTLLMDEVGLLEPGMLVAAAAFVAEWVASGRVVHFAGDARQLPPVVDGDADGDDDYASIERYDAYHDRLLRAATPPPPAPPPPPPDDGDDEDADPPPPPRGPVRLDLQVCRRVSSAASLAKLDELMALMWGPHGGGVRVPWTQPRRDAVLRRLARLPADPRGWPRGLRAVTFRRRTAERWSSVLPPAMADGDDELHWVPLGGVAALAAALARPPPAPVQGQLLRATARVRVTVDAADDDVNTEDGERERRGPPSRWLQINYEYVTYVGSGGELSIGPAWLPDDEEPWTAPVVWPHPHLLAVGGTTAHALQGTSVAFPLVVDVDDVRAMPLSWSRRWLTTALTRARDMESLYVGGLPT